MFRISVEWTDGAFLFSGTDTAELKNLVVSQCINDFILPSDIKSVTVMGSNGGVTDVALSVRGMLRMEYQRRIKF